jgi:hypothetical protein
MQFKLTAFALAAALAGAAHAQTALIPKGEGVTQPTSPASAASAAARADVKAGATAANKAGEIKKGEGPTRPATPSPSVAPRADVKADAASAVKAGAVGKGADVPASGIKK